MYTYVHRLLSDTPKKLTSLDGNKLPNKFIKRIRLYLEKY